MMKFNNKIARNNKEEPLYDFMKFDFYDDAAKIQEVRLNRQIKLQMRKEKKELIDTIDSLIEADPLV